MNKFLIFIKFLYLKLMKTVTTFLLFRAFSTPVVWKSVESAVYCSIKPSSY